MENVGNLVHKKYTCDYIVKEHSFCNQKRFELSEEKKKIEDILLENLTKPKSAEVDGQKFEQHSLKDQMEAMKFYESTKASRSRKCGLRFFKMKHGGAE